MLVVLQQTVALKNTNRQSASDLSTSELEVGETGLEAGRTWFDYHAMNFDGFDDCHPSFGRGCGHQTSWFVCNVYKTNVSLIARIIAVE